MNKDIDPLAEDFNPDAITGHKQQYLFNRQELFLNAYRGCGNEATAMVLSGIKKRTVDEWKLNDSMLFNDRLQHNFRVFCGTLESKALELALSLEKTNSPLLLITLLNANLPDKYRPNAIATDEAAAELMRKIRELSPKGNTKEAREKAVEDKGDKTMEEWIAGAPMRDEKVKE